MRSLRIFSEGRLLRHSFPAAENLRKAILKHPGIVDAQSVSFPAHPIWNCAVLLDTPAAIFAAVQTKERLCRHPGCMK